MKKHDEKIKAALDAGTQGAAQKQQQVWNNIEHKLEEVNMSRKRGHAGRWIAAAVVVGLTITAFTPLGQAAIASIADLFAPQKPIDVIVEGEKEDTDQQLIVGPQEPGESAVTYVLYLDEERYEVVGDKIVPRDFPDELPEVSMTISQSAQTPDELAAQIKAQLDADYSVTYDAQSVTQPIAAIHLRALSGYEWDDEMIEYYLVDNTQGGTFVITFKYFIEAEEGHGARFMQMLTEFHIVSADQVQ